MKGILKLFYLLLFSLLSCTGSKEKSALSMADYNIAKVKLKDLDDQAINLAKYQGKVVFINFWATWCKPCIQEMPTIASAQEKLKNEKIIFLMASNEEQDQIDKFIKRHAYNFHYVLIENLEELQIQALPTTYIFNPEGKLKFSETGFRIWDDPENIELITKIINDHGK